MRPATATAAGSTATATATAAMTAGQGHARPGVPVVVAPDVGLEGAAQRAGQGDGEDT